MLPIYRSGGLMAAFVGLLTTFQLWQVASATWTKVNMSVDADTCDDTQTTYLSLAMTNIQSMLLATIQSLGTIESNLGTKREELDDDDRATLDLFMALYGVFDTTDEDEITTAKSTITTIEWMADQLLGGLQSDTLDIAIFCSTDDFDETENQDYYWMPKHPAMMPMSESDLCPTGLRAMMQENQATEIQGTSVYTADTLIVCETAFDGDDEWIYHIDHFSTGNIDDGLPLDDIALQVGEITLLHELTHTTSFFGGQVLEDVETSDAETAYKWDLCFELAEDSTTRSKALQNADTFAYLCAGK
ncbi:hypothetical protein N7540_005828 [Penicillium herquei]|nr:hypothetical protein N7540_005828 [Penicillium herquei]